MKVKTQKNLKQFFRLAYDDVSRFTPSNATIINRDLKGFQKEKGRG